MKEKNWFLTGFLGTIVIFLIILIPLGIKISNYQMDHRETSITQRNNYSSKEIELAKKLRERGNEDKAKEILIKILKKQPENVHALTLLGEIYTSLGNYKEAYRILKKSITIDENTWTCRAMGVLLRKMKKYKKSEEYLKKAKNLANDNLNEAWAIFELGNLYKDLKKIKKSRSFYKEAIKLLPGEKYFREKLSELDKIERKNS